MPTNDDAPRADAAPEAPAGTRAGGAAISRRGFLTGVGGAAMAVGTGGFLLDSRSGESTLGGSSAGPEDTPTGTAGNQSRRAQAYRVRTDAARAQFLVRPAPEVANGDEQLYPSHIGNYSKALPHNQFGEVDPAAWASLLAALASGDPAVFEEIQLGGASHLSNPQSGLGFDMEGADPFALVAPPPPALASAEEAGEMVELYWAALLRDVNFADYATHPDVAQACADLNALSVFKGPRQKGQVTPQTLFRDVLEGTTIGPYISQFMWLPTPMGAEFVDRQLRTFQPGSDHLTSFADWLNVQNGGAPATTIQFDPQRRYIRNGRDLAAWVHMDLLYQAYLNADLLLMTAPNSSDRESSGLGCPFAASNPYNHSRTQSGYGTFGGPWASSVVPEVGARALKATWRQKWFTHRRLRPEAAGGIVHVQKTVGRYPGVLHSDLVNAPVLERIHNAFGSFLHPQSFPEGSPTHPSYTAGHATVAGACVTMLKAVFDESFVIPNPVTASEDGLSLVPYTGSQPLTVGAELNKLASNIATGRNIAGVHWRSDALQSLLLGEALAVSILRDMQGTYNEARGGFFPGFSFTSFGGQPVTV